MFYTPTLKEKEEYFIIINCNNYSKINLLFIHHGCHKLHWLFSDSFV